MSCNIDVKTELKDWSMLKQVLSNIGCEFEEGNVDVPLYGGRTRTADLRIKGKRIGFMKPKGEKGAVLVGDSDDIRHGDWEAKVLQGYGELKARSSLRKTGYRNISKTVRNDGVIILTAKRSA